MIRISIPAEHGAERRAGGLGKFFLRQTGILLRPGDEAVVEFQLMDALAWTGIALHIGQRFVQACHQPIEILGVHLRSSKFCD